ncbi:peptidoglycan-binding protein [Paracoccus sp. SCSIO 75233]|uniref:peptidoglycan-binding domain-containing protein n=1 Tax=Paracoccus sp. SCSIO 75233 TaxID=3017782 RepID=UPI0022F13D43|nr:peptidoglycan-binding domain-containing protein [Paracoccus sp. SCSIO 75233]WBU54522.1 peptidoglycan-binding domain-containing protein [Paracoccus sp. SCSIO 75233]
MKRIAILLLTAALPGMALAEDVYIRVEAKRGQQAAAQAAEGWQSRVQGLPVVTFPLGTTWTAIAFGPLPREDAEARMAALKNARTIPADSLLTPAEGIAAVAVADNRADQTGADSVTEAAQDTDEAQAATVATGETGSEAQDIATPQPAAPPPPASYIRLESFNNRAEADAALTRWRETIPEAGMWDMPNGWFGIAVGPFSEEGADQWLAALKGGEAIPADSLISSAADMGSVADAGTAPDWPLAPEAPPEMPPVAEVQEILAWAGFYDGKIDGQTGPMTRAAIAAELASQRQTPDAATAILNLMAQREAWRNELGLGKLSDDHTGLSVIAPTAKLVHQRNERALSIYGPKDESGAALILFSQPGGQQEMVDMTGLVTALGWVPRPEREIGNGSARLYGRNDTHIGEARARVSDGNVEGWVLIWPVEDAENAPRIVQEIAGSLTREQPPRADRDTAAAVEAAATAETVQDASEDAAQQPATGREPIVLGTDINAAPAQQ